MKALLLLAATGRRRQGPRVVQVGLWVFGTAFALASMILAVALDSHAGQFALALIVSMYIAVSGMRHAAVFRRADAHPSLHAAVLVRYMGMIWAWAAMTMLAIYQFLLEWPLWLGAFILLLCGALSLLFVAKVLDRDAMDMNDDPRILRLVTGITRAQFGLTCIALGGLLATGKLSVSAYGVGPAWAAVNILIATALALAIMSGYLMTFAEQSAMDASAGQQPRALVKRRVQAAPSTPVTFRPTASVRKAEPARMRTA